MAKQAANVAKKQRAAMLRADGYTYTDIAKELSVTPGTVSKWADKVTFQRSVTRHINEKHEHIRGRAIKELDSAFDKILAIASVDPWYEEYEEEDGNIRRIKRSAQETRVILDASRDILKLGGAHKEIVVTETQIDRVEIEYKDQTEPTRIPMADQEVEIPLEAITEQFKLQQEVEGKEGDDAFKDFIGK